MVGLVVVVVVVVEAMVGLFVVVVVVVVVSQMCLHLSDELCKVGCGYFEVIIGVVLT